MNDLQRAVLCELDGATDEGRSLVPFDVLYSRLECVTAVAQAAVRHAVEGLRRSGLVTVARHLGVASLALTRDGMIAAAMAKPSEPRHPVDIAAVASARAMNPPALPPAVWASLATKQAQQTVVAEAEAIERTVQASLLPSMLEDSIMVTAFAAEALLDRLSALRAGPITAETMTLITELQAVASASLRLWAVLGEEVGRGVSELRKCV